MFSYRFGGIKIASEILLPSLRPGGGADISAPEMRIVAGAGPAPAEDKLHFAWNGRFRMRLSEAGGQWRFGSPWGAFLVERNASVVRVFGMGVEAPNDTILRDLLTRRVLPRLVKLKGGATYHAASLARADKGVLIMGASGAGKSTMSVGLSATHGWDLLGDDVAFVWNEGVETIAPAAADAAIWQQSCTGLGLADSDTTPLFGYEGKRVYRPTGTPRLDPAPVAGIFFLDRTDCAAPRLERCARGEALERAKWQIVNFNPNGAATEERVQSVLRLNAMLRRVPAWTLTYPAAFDALGAVSDRIAAALGEG